MFKNLLHKKINFLYIYSVMALTLFCITFANKIPLRINLTSSMPQGIYLLTSSDMLHAGDWVMVCLDDALAKFGLQRGYLHVGSCKNGSEPLLKKIVAMHGDKIQHIENFTKINNKILSHSFVLTYDQHGRTLPTIPYGIYILQTNQLWLYGTISEKSWDSRYFGAINSSQIIYKAKPLFIWHRGKSS